MNYFSGKTGPPCSCYWYFKKPVVSCRIICLLFSLTILGCVANAQSNNGGNCPISRVDPSTCNYEIGLSVVAILTTLVFLYFDIYIGRLRDYALEKKFITIDIIVAFVHVLLWFIGFWYLFNRWSESDRSYLKGFIIDNVKCGLAFSFISIISWGTIFGIGIIRLRVVSHTITYEDGTSEAEHLHSSRAPTYVISNSAI